MPSMQSPVRTRVARVAAAACVVFLFGLAVSTARAQSGEPEAPWQAHPYEGQQVPPPDTPCDSDGPCGIGCGHKRAAAHGEEPCDEECNVATDWLHVFEPCGQFSFHGEYLAWWTKSTNYPPLVTTNTDSTAPAREHAGVLDWPGTEVLFGGGDGDPGIHSGARFTLGYWFTPSHETGLDVTYTFLGNTAATFDRASNGSVILATPYYDVQIPGQTSWLVAYDNGTYADKQTGVLSIRNAQELNFVEVLTHWSMIQQCNRNLDFLFGYRYGRFAENLTIDETTTRVALGDTIQKVDAFDARNEFNGFELGFVSTTRYCRWSLDVLAKLAVGNTHSRVDIGGTTTVNNTPVPGGGLLALPTNSVPVERNNFSAIPELGLTLGYDLTCRLKATFGYTFVYWSAVMRPGDQIDTNLNGSQIPPPGTLIGVPSPQPKAVMTDFWAQGFNLGLNYRY